MTDNEMKQQLSIAFVHAIASRAGYKVRIELVDDDSVDLIIGARGYIRETSYFRSPSIEIQLKSTSQDILKNNHLSFRLPLKNYEDLSGRSALPRYLVVLLLPSDPTIWLEQDEERMISRGCAYYLNLRGWETDIGAEGTGEGSSEAKVTVRLPRANRFTVATLGELMHRASRRGRR